MTTVKMEINPANVNSFKSIFNSIETIIQSITFECFPDKVEINCIDGSKTVFMSCELRKSYFKEYVCEESDRFTIDTVFLKKILKSCKSELCLEFNESKCKFISLTKTFEIVLNNDDLAATKPRLYSLPTNADVPISFLKSMLKDMEIFSHDVTISAFNGGVRFSSGNDGWNLGTFEDNYETDIKYNPETNPKKRGQVVKVSTEKFSTCIGADKVSDMVNLEVATDMPLILTMKNEGIVLQYLIAPKVDMSE